MTKCTDTSMKLLMKLVTLFAFAVASMLFLGLFYSWWSNNENLYYTKTTLGRGVWELYADDSVSVKTEMKSTNGSFVQLHTETIPNKTSKSSGSPLIQKVTLGTSHQVPNSMGLNDAEAIPERSTSSPSDASLVLSDSTLKPRSMDVTNKGQVVRILLVTYFRGGSSFLGDLLQQNRKTFYHFEPLHCMTTSSRINKTRIDEAFITLSSMYKCNFRKLPSYMKCIADNSLHRDLSRNRFLMTLCHVDPSVCFTYHYLRKTCLQAPVHVMKVTRMYLSDALEFIKRNRDLKIKLIYLTRDPRGIFNSRRVRVWCRRDGCSRSEDLCKDMSLDIQHLENNSEYFKWLRYEDLCLNPENVTRILYSWLGIPYTKRVTKFLKLHTKAKNANIRDPYSTRRNSSTASFRWLSSLSFSHIQEVQTNCEAVMRTLKYKAIGNGTYHGKKGPESVLELP